MVNQSPSGTIIGGEPELPKDERTPQQKCEDKGGFWDAERGVCLLVKKPEKPPEEVPEVPSALETFTDPRTGRTSGITTPGGKTFLGLSPEEVQQVATGEQERVARPEGTAPVGTARILAEEQRRKISLAQNVGFIDAELASQLEEQGLNVKEFLAAGTQQAIKSALAFGATGAGVGLVAGPGAPVTVPAAGAIGAGIGIVKGFIEGVAANIKDQRQDLVTVKTKELRQRKTALNNYIQAANMNPAEAETYILAYNIEKSLIIRDYNTLVKRGNKDLEFWGTDATPQIVEYEVFFESVQPSLDIRMEQAVLKPEPTRAFISLGEEES